MQKPIAAGTVEQKRPTLKSGKRPWGWKGLRYAEDGGGEPEESVLLPSVAPALPAAAVAPVPPKAKPMHPESATGIALGGINSEPPSDQEIDDVDRLLSELGV